MSEAALEADRNGVTGLRASPRPRKSGARRRQFLLLLVVLAGSGGSFSWWWNTRTEVFTDNAYVVGNITPIASDVSGQVVALFVDDNMIVQPGDPIAQINPIEFQIAVDEALAAHEQAEHAAEAADVSAQFTDDDRAALLVAAEAERAAAEQAVRAAEVAVQTHARLHEKEKELQASLESQLPGLEAMQRNAQYYYERFRSLAESGDIPVQEFNDREAAYRQAIAEVRSLQNEIDSAERQVMASELQLQEAKVRLAQSGKVLANAEAQVGRAKAAQLEPTVAADTALAEHNRQALAAAQLREAKINLSNTLIRAPRAGVISRRTIQVGMTVDAQEPFLSIVPLDFDNVWIVANMRETQMAVVRVGQAVSIRVDAIPDQVFSGWVESVAGGSGAVFSMFPPDNATGNFVRVVQRLPVRIRFAEQENYQNRIRPGMSTRIAIDTTHYIRDGARVW